MNSTENIRILIVRPDRMGDVILSTPLPREIKKKFPNSYIAVFVRQYTKDIFLNNPFVDEILIYEDDSSYSDLMRNVRMLRSFDLTHAFMLLPNARINLILFFAGIRKRFGVGNKFYQFITNVKSVYRHKLEPLRHEADYCLDFARKIGVNSFDFSTEIHLSEAEKLKAQFLKKAIAPDGERIIAVHSTFGGSTPNMPPEEYRYLIEALISFDGIKVAVTDVNPPEILAGIDEVYYVKESLRELFVLLSISDLFISSSTGPSHAAAAIGTKTLTLFCPLKACSPQLWSPMGNDAYYVFPENEYCRQNCPGEPKLCRFEGPGGINHISVLNKVKELINIC